MKVVAINSSPNMDKGNTAVILNPFLEGLKQAGADVELFYTKKLDIKPCQGEFHCWLITPGKCFQKDDMQMLLPKIGEADVIVLATPLYVDGVTGPMKNILDRIIPGGQPFFELRDGHCRHPGRGKSKITKLVLVSNCGFWEIDNFDAMLVHMRAVCKNTEWEFAGALLRPHGPALNDMLNMGAPVNDVIEAAKNAGQQLIKQGKISPETLKIISRELLPLELYVKIINQNFQQGLDKLEKKKLDEKNKLSIIQ